MVTLGRIGFEIGCIWCCMHGDHAREIYILLQVAVGALFRPMSLHGSACQKGEPDMENRVGPTRE